MKKEDLLELERRRKSFEDFQEEILAGAEEYINERSGIHDTRTREVKAVHFSEEESKVTLICHFPVSPIGDEHIEIPMEEFLDGDE